MYKTNSDNYIVLGDFEKVEALKSMLVEKYSIADMDIKTLYADDAGVEKICLEMDSLPFFSSRRLLLVRNVEKLTRKDCEKLETYFSSPASNISLILSGESIKPPLSSYAAAPAASSEKEKNGIYPGIFKMRKRSDRSKLISMFREHLAQNERDFTPVINAVEIYLKNLLLSQKKIDADILVKFKKLHQLDFELKTGIVRPGPELEVYLYSLLS